MLSVGSAGRVGRSSSRAQTTSDTHPRSGQPAVHWRAPSSASVTMLGAEAAAAAARAALAAFADGLSPERRTRFLASPQLGRLLEIVR